MSAAIPITGLLVILAVDALISARQWPIPILGALDETAHVVTAIVVLAVFGWSSAAVRMTCWALLGSVLIDIDHLPLYTFAPQFSVGGRPPTHSLVTIVTLVAAAGAIRRWRGPLLGLALGLVLHFARDVATGYGVPLLFPASPIGIRIPYWTYAAAVGVAAVWGTVRLVARDWPGRSTGLESFGARPHTGVEDR